MMSVMEMGNVGAGSCDCCSLIPEETPTDYGCGERKEVFTPREQEVLKRIREAGERAKNLKKQLAGHEAYRLESGERKRIEAELDELRRLRTALEGERVAAAEERMRYLGHA
jgi:hypothetical protein